MACAHSMLIMARICEPVARGCTSRKRLLPAPVGRRAAAAHTAPSPDARTGGAGYCGSHSCRRTRPCWGPPAIRHSTICSILIPPARATSGLVSREACVTPRSHLECALLHGFALSQRQARVGVVDSARWRVRNSRTELVKIARAQAPPSPCENAWGPHDAVLSPPWRLRCKK